MLCYPRRSLCSRMSRSKLVTQKQCCVHTSFFFLFANLCSYFVPRAIPLIPYLRADTCVYIFCNFATSNGWKPRQRHFVSNSSFLSKRKTECQKTKKREYSTVHTNHGALPASLSWLGLTCRRAAAARAGTRVPARPHPH